MCQTDGMDVTEIAKQLKVTPITLYSWINETGATQGETQGGRRQAEVPTNQAASKHHDTIAPEIEKNDTCQKFHKNGHPEAPHAEEAQKSPRDNQAGAPHGQQPATATTLSAEKYSEEKLIAYASTLNDYDRIITKIHEFSAGFSPLTATSASNTSTIRAALPASPCEAT